MSSTTEQDKALAPDEPDRSTVQGAAKRIGIDEVRDYWNQNVHDWKIASHEPGHQAYFEETESYRLEKLDYLSGALARVTVPDKHLIDVGCGLGNDCDSSYFAADKTARCDRSIRANRDGPVSYFNFGE